MNMTNSTEVSPHLLWHDSILSTLCIGSPIVSLISSTCCLVVLNTHLKMLHVIFKTLLNIILVHNILCFLGNIAISIYILTYQEQTFVICTIRQLTVAIPVYLVAFGIALMSFLRYHIAWKISNQESTMNTFRYMIVLVILFLLFEYVNVGPLTFVAVIFHQTPSATSKCAGSSIHGTPALAIYNFIKFIAILFMGMWYDYLMIKFLKKQNKHKEPGQAKLVPWKSGQQEYDYLVPVSATITSILGGIVGTFIVLYVVRGHFEDEMTLWKITAIVFFTSCSLVMPIMISMTLRANKNKKSAPVIPKGPMYHGDEEKFEEEIEMQEEVAEGDVDMEDETSSQNDQVIPVPQLILVKPIVRNVECHI